GPMLLENRLSEAVSAKEVIMTSQRKYYGSQDFFALDIPVTEVLLETQTTEMRPGVAVKTIKSIRPQAFEQTHLFDLHAESSLDFEKVQAAVKDGYNRPFLLIDSNIIREKARRFAAAMPRVRPHYAVKANPDPRVLKVVMQEGGGFEIASIAELDLLLELGVPA